MADLYLTPAERYTAALGGFYYGDLPEPGTVYTQLIKDILDGATPDKEPKNILARFIYSLYISDLGDPYPRYELAKLLYWKLHDITPTKSGSILTVTIDGKEDYMTINTDLSRLWYKVLFGSKTDVITEFPYIFNTMQTKLSDWELFGNAEVSGTPTPDSPVMPEGTGERTGNLWSLYPERTIGGVTLSWDGEKISYSGTCISSQNLTMNIELKAGTYTMKANANRNPTDDTASCIDVYRPSPFFMAAIENRVAATSSRTFTFDEDTNVILRIRIANGVNYDGFEIRPMLNLGSTALPYEPYGYKIPISSANTTTPVYLGEVETTRKVKKLALTGEEDTWKQSGAASNTFYADVLDYLRQKVNITICSHYTSQANINGAAEMQDGNVSFYANAGQTGRYFYVRDSNFATLADLKSYLAAQYAAGTPVTVWYVLAEPETGIVNEPLMKIGDYADSMSRIQTGIDIPTIIGQNTLDVLTTVKPSSMSIEYTSAEENQSRSKRISLLKSPLKKGLIK